jgi:hypothetical protein
MDQAQGDRPRNARKMRTYTVAALLGLFIVAALVALGARLLPRGLSRLVSRVRRDGTDGTDGTDTN